MNMEDHLNWRDFPHLFGGRKSAAGSGISSIKEIQETLYFCGEDNLTCQVIVNGRQDDTIDSRASGYLLVN